MTKFEELKGFLDQQDRDNLKVLLRDVRDWSSPFVQTESIMRHVFAIELLRDFDEDQARTFLRNCILSRPTRLERWDGLIV